jgi:hypothetical protein
MVLSITTTQVDDVNAYDEDAFFYAWYSALLYGHEATGWGEYLYSGNGVTQTPYRTRPSINSGTVFTSVIEHLLPNVFTRQADFGTITVNTATHTASWSSVAPKPALTVVEPDPFYNLELLPNYPNPFNPETQIVYQIPEAKDVQLVIYNILGQSIGVLVQDFKAAGKYQVTWDGKDAYGRLVSSGVYLYRLVNEKSVLARRMLLVK